MHFWHQMLENKYLFEFPTGLFLLCYFGPASVRSWDALDLDQVTVAIVTLDAEPGLCLPVAAVWHQRLKREVKGGILCEKSQNTEGF